MEVSIPRQVGQLKILVVLLIFGVPLQQLAKMCIRDRGFRWMTATPPSDAESVSAKLYCEDIGRSEHI